MKSSQPVDSRFSTATTSSEATSDELKVFRVTQRIYGYRRYLVRALTSQEALTLVEQAAPLNEPANQSIVHTQIEPIPDVVDDGMNYFGPVVFVDSLDGRETFFE